MYIAGLIGVVMMDSWRYDERRAVTSDKFLGYILELLEDVPRGSGIIDLGCGPGRLAYNLAVRGYHVLGVDSSEEMVGFAKEAYRTSNLKFARGSVLAVPCKSEGFEAAIAVDVLHHVNMEKCLEEVHRILKEKGKLIVVEVNASNPLMQAYMAAIGEKAIPKHRLLRCLRERFEVETVGHRIFIPSFLRRLLPAEKIEKFIEKNNVFPRLSEAVLVRCRKC